MTPTLTLAIEEMRSKVNTLADEITQDPRVLEIQKLLAALNPLEDLCGQARTTLGGILRFGTAPASDPGKASIIIRPDEFHGKEGLDAAKRYLKKRGDAGEKSAPFQDIVAAIRRGGGDPGNEDKLKVSLARSTWDVTKIGEDRFGLLEFFPDIKRGAKKKKAADGIMPRDSMKGEVKDKDIDGNAVLTRDSEQEAGEDDASEAEAPNQ